MSDSLNMVGLAAASTIVRQNPAARALAYVELSKPRIAMLVLVATGAGFFMGLPAHAQWSALPLLGHVLWSVALVAAGANALNQNLESDFDALMQRTASRPIPSGRLTPVEVLAFGLLTGITGVAWMALFVNLPSAQLAGLTLLLYVLLYTPLKRWTPLCVFVGAVPGALPPVIGWTAASGTLSPEAWPLFAIVFLWQLPHFAAIAWLHREDYARAGYPMLPVIDPGGHRTNLHMITHSVGLLMVSFIPVVGHSAGLIYAIGAMVLGLAFLAFGIYFVIHKTNTAARWHLLASVLYLPALCACLLADKLCRSLVV